MDSDELRGVIDGPLPGGEETATLVTIYIYIEGLSSIRAQTMVESDLGELTPATLYL